MSCATESQEQQALITWWQTMRMRLPAIGRLFAIPNGGQRSIATASRLKAEGVRAGVWDLCMPTEKGTLWIEMKVGTNKLTQAQVEWCRQGAESDEWMVAYNWQSAAWAILEYVDSNDLHPNDDTILQKAIADLEMYVLRVHAVVVRPDRSLVDLQQIQRIPSPVYPSVLPSSAQMPPYAEAHHSRC